MKLTIASAIIACWLAPMVSSSASHVIVIENFLSIEECDEILRQQSSVEQQQDSSIEVLDDEAKTFNPIKISHNIKRRIATTLAFVMSSCDKVDDETCEMHPKVSHRLETYLNSTMVASDNPELVVTTVTQTTAPHTDCWLDPTTDERVNVTTAALVFLDDEKDGFFAQEGQDHVPAKRGNLVLFDGTVEHRTILPSVTDGPLHLLGPCMLTHGHGLAHVAITYCDGKKACGETPAPNKSKKMNKKTKNNVGTMEY